MLVCTETERLIERAADSLTDGFYLSNGFVIIVAKICFQYYYELVAPETSDSVAFANAGDQARSDLLQQQVPQAMAERIIEQFKVIEIDEQ